MVISNSSNNEFNSINYKRRGNKNPLLLLYKICPQENIFPRAFPSHG